MKRNFWPIIFGQLLASRSNREHLEKTLWLTWDTNNKLQHGNKYKHWTILNLVLGLNCFSFSNPNPKPTHQPKHQTQSPKIQFSQRILHVKHYSVTTHQRWARIRTWSDYNFFENLRIKTGSDWENFCCFNVIILTKSKFLVVIRFHRFAKWSCIICNQMQKLCWVFQTVSIYDYPNCIQLKLYPFLFTYNIEF